MNSIIKKKIVQILRGIDRRRKYFFYKWVMLLLEFFDTVPRLRRFKIIIYSIFIRNIGDRENPELLEERFFFEKYGGDVIIESIYPTSNDVVDLNYVKGVSRDTVIVGVGNLAVLDILSCTKASSIICCDVNKSQLVYLQFFVDLIRKTKDRSEFLSVLFKKEKRFIDEFLVRLDKRNESLMDLEQYFWSIPQYSCIIKDIIHKEFLSYNFIKNKENILGITHKKLGKYVFGNVTILFSFFPQVHSNYHNFPLFKENGFLFSEKNFQTIKCNLYENKLSYYDKGITPELINYVCKKYPYQSIVFWLSNVMNFWFIHKVPKWTNIVSTLLTYKYIERKYFGGINILEDKRSNFFTEYTRATPHWNTYHKLNSFLTFTNHIEIVSKRKNKKNISLFKPTVWYYDEVTKEKIKSLNGKVCVLHCLLSDGVNIVSMKKLIDNIRAIATNVIIIEHNSESLDFLNSSTKAVRIDDIKHELGIPKDEFYVSGEYDDKRNFILIY